MKEDRYINVPKSYQEFCHFFSNDNDGVNLIFKMKDHLLSDTRKLHSDYISNNLSQKPEYLCEYIFETIIKQPSTKIIHRHAEAHSCAALESMRRILTALCTNENDPWRLGHAALFYDLLFDYIDLLTWHASLVEQVNYVSHMHRLYRVTTYETYLAACQIFLSVCDTNLIGGPALRSTSIFLLRNSLENRIRRVIGIDSIEKKKDGSPVIRTAIPECLKILKKYSNEIQWPVSICILEKIQKWSNTYVHRALTGYVWQNEWAIHYCAPLFTPENFAGKHSIYGSVQMKKETYFNMQNEFKKSIGEENTVKFLKTPEVILT